MYDQEKKSKNKEKKSIQRNFEASSVGNGLKLKRKSSDGTLCKKFKNFYINFNQITAPHPDEKVLPSHNSISKILHFH